MRRTMIMCLVVLVAIIGVVTTAFAAGQDAPVPADLAALWAAGLALATTTVTQLLRAAAAPLERAPAWVKALVALAIAFGTTKLADVFGAPIPPDLGGFAAVAVNWLAAMGLHRLAKLAGVVESAPEVP